MAETFENLDNILTWLSKRWGSNKSFQGIEQAREAGRRKIKRFLLENDSEKYPSSLSQQSIETKPREKLVLVNREPLLYLEFNKPNKQNISEKNLF